LDAPGIEQVSGAFLGLVEGLTGGKTGEIKAAANSGKRRNCERCHSFKFAAAGNFAANFFFLRPGNLKFCPKCSKKPSCSGKGQGFQGISLQSLEPIPVTGRFKAADYARQRNPSEFRF
jgi:hypothetical protein